MKKLISIIVPCHNESENIIPFTERLNKVISEISSNYEIEIIFINDGSTDNTLEKLFEVHKNYNNIKIIDFSRQFGKEAALTAGLDFSKGDAVILIDADLQHPPELIPKMIKEWENGFDVVLTKRRNRDTDSKLRKLSSILFYNLQNALSDIKIPKDVGDFRLLDRKVVDALKLFPERRRFMKGLFTVVGFKSTIIEFDVQERFAGKSSFNFWKLFNFAIEGLTSFSTFPLRIWTYFGFIIALLSFLYGLFIVAKTLIYGRDVPGYASIMCMILFLGGVQLISIGVLGEYIGGIYNEVKRRPIYIINKKIGFKEDEEDYN